MEYKKYFLFGKIAANDYDYLKWESFLINLKKGKYEYEICASSYTINEIDGLLLKDEEWRGHVRISKNEYEQINKLKK